MQFLTRILGLKLATKLRLLRKPKSVEYYGLTVPVSHNQIPRAVIKQLLQNAYEAPEINALTNLINEGDRILELGTGLGIVSGIASQIKDNITIETYEANPNLIEHIHALHALNGIKNVQVNNAMLTPNPTVETRPFHLHQFFPEGSVIETERTEDTIDVPVQDLNAVISRFSPSVLVCDIEGAEADIFSGADLNGIRAIILEIHPHLISRQAVKQIYDSCIAAELYPVQDLSDALVIAFKRIP